VVRKWRVRVANNLGEAVVLHHDDKDMIESANACGNRSLGSKHCARQHKHASANDCIEFHEAPFGHEISPRSPVLLAGFSQPNNGCIHVRLELDKEFVK